MNLNDHIGILIHSADLAITSYVRKQLEPFNLAPEQNLIMMILWNQDGVSSNELVSALNNKAGIARMIASLEGKGYIKKVDDPKDKRSFKIHLTEEGKQLSHAVIDVHRNMRETLTKGMTNEEVHELQKLITKVMNNI
ncbi:MarR family winged helix-turn-helix transcriptional regulator [Bacillus sp. SD088]|uniref:MarR family winged helix-turn-helix transcriptional regulator n=1 Tax=Bacillus sp. SD088 TaxID=2782012 RepID=UPI001A95FA8B|nr:MarR family transcriptional regulator [Bacillus sp. SD088]MBO0995043.1 MarR family transcriptional regulator [Bacillus sp. SD088]